MNRYVVTFNRYLWAKSDEEAIEQAKQFADETAKIDDNHCEVTNIVAQPFATLESRLVYGDAIEYKEETQ